MDLLR